MGTACPMKIRQDRRMITHLDVTYVCIIHKSAWYLCSGSIYVSADTNMSNFSLSDPTIPHSFARKCVCAYGVVLGEEFPCCSSQALYDGFHHALVNCLFNFYRRESPALAPELDKCCDIFVWAFPPPFLMVSIFLPLSFLLFFFFSFVFRGLLYFHHTI